MKIGLQNGGCDLRFQCVNVDKDCCEPGANDDEDFIICDYFKKEIVENNVIKKAGWKENFVNKFIGVEELARRNNKFCRWLNRIINGCHISIGVFVPKSMSISHGGVGLIIGGDTKIGKNVKFYQNVTIGNKKGFPVIKDNVRILPNSVIVGKITIGKNSIIGAGTFIDKDIPLNSVVYNQNKLIIKKMNSLQMKHEEWGFVD